MLQKKWLRMAGIARKQRLGGTRIIKKLFEQRNMHSKLLQNRSSSDLQSRYINARKSCSFDSKEVQRRARSWVRFKLFIGKQHILADDPSFAWQKIKSLFLH